MDRFKFRAPSSKPQANPTSSGLNNRLLEDDDDDGLWMDDIDEQTLLQASQITEPEPPRMAFSRGVDIDPATLSKMISRTNAANDDDEVWKSDGPPKHRLPVTQTVFGDDPKKRSEFCNSFDDVIAASSVQSMKETSVKPPSSRVMVNSLTNGQTGSSSLPEVEKLKAENQKLNQLQQSKQGEISYLRTELAKRQAAFEKERQEYEKKLEAQRVAAQQAERRRQRELESLRCERDFMKRDIEQVSEMVAKKERDLSRGVMSSQVPFPQSQNSSKAAMNISVRPTKKPRLAENIDESFFEEPSKVIHAPITVARKAATVNAEVQTVERKGRRYELTVDAGFDLTKQIETFAGVMSLITLAESGESSISSTIDEVEDLMRRFTLYCKSVVGHHARLKSADSSQEVALVKRIISDLHAARIILSRVTSEQDSSCFQGIDRDNYFR